MTQPGLLLAAASARSVLAAEAGLADRIRAVSDRAESLRLQHRFVEAVVTHRVLPVVAPAWEPLGCAPEVGQALAGQLRAEALAAMGTVAMTARVSSALAGAGIPHLMIKGPALAIQTAGDPLARGAGDVDVLLPWAAIGDAVAALGCDRVVGMPRPGEPTFAALLRSQKELTLLESGVEIDLHWRLDDARGCLSWTFGDLRAAAEDVTIGGVRMATLGRAQATIYNASHAGSDAWSHLRPLVDQARLQQGQDLAYLRAEAYRVGAGRRWDLAQVMLARFLDRPSPPAPRSISRTADAMWRWLLAGEGPRERVNARASVRGFSTNVLTLDSPRAAAQRVESVLWPVGAMADRALGHTGDRHPWLYPLATPYFLPKRLLARWSEPGRGEAQAGRGPGGE